jgi:hypothetical protein
LMLDLRCLCCHHHNPGNLSWCMWLHPKCHARVRCVQRTFVF